MALVVLLPVGVALAAVVLLGVMLLSGEMRGASVLYSEVGVGVNSALQ